MVNNDILEFMKNLKVINKDFSEYNDPDKGVQYIVPNSYVFARCDYLELTNEELKKERFNQTIDKSDIKFNYIDSTRPVPKYEQTKVEADRYTIVDAKVKVNQIWLVSNGMKMVKSFNNKKDALKLVESINAPLKRYFE